MFVRSVCATQQDRKPDKESVYSVSFSQRWAAAAILYSREISCDGQPEEKRHFCERSFCLSVLHSILFYFISWLLSGWNTIKLRLTGSTWIHPSLERQQDCQTHLGSKLLFFLVVKLFARSQFSFGVKYRLEITN